MNYWPLVQVYSFLVAVQVVSSKVNWWPPKRKLYSDVLGIWAEQQMSSHLWCMHMCMYLQVSTFCASDIHPVYPKASCSLHLSNNSTAGSQCCLISYLHVWESVKVCWPGTTWWFSDTRLIFTTTTQSGALHSQLLLCEDNSRELTAKGTHPNVHGI